MPQKVETVSFSIHFSYFIIIYPIHHLHLKSFNHFYITWIKSFHISSLCILSILLTITVLITIASQKSNLVQVFTNWKYSCLSSPWPCVSLCLPCPLLQGHAPDGQPQLPGDVCLPPASHQDNQNYRGWHTVSLLREQSQIWSSLCRQDLTSWCTTHTAWTKGSFHQVTQALVPVREQGGWWLCWIQLVVLLRLCSLVYDRFGLVLLNISSSI